MHKYIVAEWGGVSGSSYQSVGNWGSVFILTLIIFSTCLFGQNLEKPDVVIGSGTLWNCSLLYWIQTQSLTLIFLSHNGKFEKVYLTREDVVCLEFGDLKPFNSPWNCSIIQIIFIPLIGMTLFYNYFENTC